MQWESIAHFNHFLAHCVRSGSAVFFDDPLKIQLPCMQDERCGSEAKNSVKAHSKHSMKALMDYGCFYSVFINI